jgi:TPR repeat protein
MAFRRITGPFLVMALFILSAGSARAGLDEGVAAYERGDYAAALREFMPLDVSGDSAAQYNLGVMYGNGAGMPQDYAEAARWYRLAADKGYAPAQYNLGVRYDDGEGVPQDYAEAVRWYRLAANQGLAPAQYALGVMYDRGHGLPQNYGEAVRWYRMAAAQGYANAQSDLGAMYALGQGVPQNYANAVRWFRMAADQGYANAQFNLGVMYHRGQGVPESYSEAVRWYQMAAAQGDAKAQHNLGMMYVRGQGVTQDDVQAYMWLNLAAARSDGELRRDSAKLREVVAARLTPDQRARGQELARNWQPTLAENATGHSPDRPQKRARLYTDEEVFGAPQKRRLDSTGSGFVIGQDGQIVTNHHVVAECSEVRIRPAGREAIPAAVVARDPGNDLAMLRSSAHLPLAVLRNDSGIRPGDSVVAVGFPLPELLAAEANVTTGTVSALAGIGNDARFLQMTVPVQPGNSGGPLLDLEGRVVGVVVGKLDAIKIASVTGDIPQNVNFAIKAEVVRSFLEASGVASAAAHGWWENDPLADGPAAVGAEAKAFTVLIECWK